MSTFELKSVCEESIAVKQFRAYADVHVSDQLLIYLIYSINSAYISVISKHGSRHTSTHTVGWLNMEDWQNRYLILDFSKMH